MIFLFFVCFLFVFFFFQAEDGIRDHCVTGVQTCAHPSTALSSSKALLNNVPQVPILSSLPKKGSACTNVPQIGRASCRERA